MILCYRINSFTSSYIFSTRFLSLHFYYLHDPFKNQCLLLFLVILLYSANGEIDSEAVSSPASLRILDATSTEPLEEDRCEVKLFLLTVILCLIFINYL